jgi:acyl-CoA reductase-like NAD-dependent aldehyde dehydrogenase
MVIGGEKLPGSSGECIELVNPATEEIHARVPHGQVEDVDRAVRAARHAYDEGPWPRMTPTDRGKLMYRLRDLVEKHADELALLDTQDMGKPYHHARNHDVPGAMEFLRFYAGFCDKIRGSEVPCGPDKHVYIVREPLGVVAGILPWNFPLAIATQKLAPVLACGNTIVLKPAEQSPRSVLRLAELCLEAGFPPGVVNVVTGLGETTGASLVSHPAVDKISFTGSTEVGRLIMHAAAEQIRKVTLELGGKTANIVFPDADQDAALASAIFTSFYNSGQVCTSGSRLVVHRRIHDKFLEDLTGKINLLNIGDPMKPDTKLGPLVSRQQYEKVNGYIALGQQEYPFISCGKRSGVTERGFYVNPVIFDRVHPKARIAQEEIFGPVLSVIEFENENEAVQIANQTRYGLVTAIWTNDLTRAHRLAAQVDSGVVWINCTRGGAVSIPFEGHRDSGIGVDGGVEVVESFTKLKSVVVNLDPTPHPWGA